MFPNRKFGELMIERNLINKTQLSKALKKQQSTGRRIGSILVENGDITETQLGDFLSFYYDVPKIELTSTSISSQVLSLIDEDLISNAGIIPFRILEDATGHKTLMLAMIDPTDDSAINKAEQLTQMEVEPFVITHGLFIETYKHLIEDVKQIDSSYQECDTHDLLTALIELLSAQGTLSKEDLSKLLMERNKNK